MVIAIFMKSKHNQEPDVTRSPKYPARFMGKLPFVAALVMVLAACVAAVCYASADGGARILSIKAIEHTNFHRLVIELTDHVKPAVRRNKDVITIGLHGVDMPDPVADRPSTDVIKFRSIYVVKDAKGVTTNIKISVSEKARYTVEEGGIVRGGSIAGPYSLVLDVYPAYSKPVSEDGADANAPSKRDNEDPARHSDAKSGKKTAATAAKKAQEAKKQALKAIDDMTAGNAARSAELYDGWKWGYRKKMIALMRGASESMDTVAPSVLRAELNVTGVSKEALIKELTEVTKRMDARGEHGKAVTLNGIITVYGTGKGASELESLLRSSGDAGLNQLGRLVLGRHYENKGFDPEAQGYYLAAVNDKNAPKGSAARHAAMFELGRLAYINSRYDDARRWLEKSLPGNFIDTRIWLANTLAVKGEVEPAWKLYKEVLSERRMDSLDPLTIMSYGDVCVLKKNYEDARAAYGMLYGRYERDEDLSVFFSLKAGDSYMAEGRSDDAIRVYAKTKEKLKGEPWAYAGMALADALSRSNDREYLLKAQKIYKSIDEGSYPVSDYALTKLASLDIRLGKHDAAISEIERFPFRYTTSPLRPDIASLKGSTAAEWMEELYGKADYYATVKVYAKYGRVVPFGKKAQTSLTAGKAYYNLSLYPSAINSLNNAVKLGRDTVVEEAMIMLARSYLAQGDAGSVERMVKSFSGRFPNSRYSDDARKLLSKAAYAQGDDRAALAYKGSPEDIETIILKANIHVRHKRYKDALAMFEKAARVYAGRDDKKNLAVVYLAIADINYALEKYEKAIDGYKTALQSLPADRADDKSWALYRMAQGYTRLKKGAQRDEAVKELGAVDDDFARAAINIFKEPAKTL